MLPAWALPLRCQPPRGRTGWPREGAKTPSTAIPGIWDRVHLRRLDPLYVAQFPDHRVVAHADPFRYQSDLIDLFPGEATGIRSYLDEAWACIAM